MCGRRPFETQLSECCQLLLGELVPPRPGVRYPYTQFHDYRLHPAVDHDLFAVAARNRPMAFPFDPLCESRETSLESLLRLSRALRRATSCRTGQRCFGGLDTQCGQPLPLL
ncbi:conserved hypothetical protein [Streptomyces coelicolor A3(2)]|uniref:Uncharacterized protein n=1 Tax=Streptomyces coelicolor (strain ATCC BAA-471 / A3(2) / M145) TaxID=100226 RepID=Q9S1Y5_STRCO|nr:hypothetical protein [Streptomyces coelicolor A3(2)]CAC03656.1 conserved hypothetical protein [Streptomyces coelicolor A3(2)]